MRATVMNNFYVISYNDEILRGLKVFKKSNYYLVEPIRNYNLNELIGKKVVLIDYSSPFYFAKDKFSKAPTDILLYQIREKINPLSIFSRSPYIVFKVIEETLTDVDLTFLAIDPLNLKRNLNFLLSKGIRVIEHYHFVSAIGALSCALSTSPILSVFVSENYFFILITEGEDIVYLRIFNADDFSSITSSNVETGILSTLDYYHRFSDRHIEGYIAYGPKRDLVPKLGGIIPLDPYWPSLRGADNEFLLNHPEFYGVLFCPKEFDLLPDIYKFCNTHFARARKVVILCLCLSLFNFSVWTSLNRKVEYISSSIHKLESTINKNIAEIDAKYPKNLNNFKKFLLLSQVYSRQIRVDWLLEWLAINLPAYVEVNKLVVEDSDSSLISSRTNTRRVITNAVKGLLSSSSKIIDLSLSATGSPKKTQSLFYKVLGLLQVNFDIKHSKFVYDLSRKKGFFYFTLAPCAGGK